MAEFYEFHDSVLTGIEYQERQIVLKIEAYRHTWTGQIGEGTGTGWYQPIEITIVDATIEPEFNAFPVEILRGHLAAAGIESLPEDLIDNEIPASLTGSGDAEIHVEGIEEATGKYKSIRIRGKSIAITHKGEARFVEDLPDDFRRK